MDGDCYYNEFDPFAAEWLQNAADNKEIPSGRVDSRSITEVRPADLMGLRQCHFFAGIAGWPVALRLAGYDWLECWSGSCPCQPFSTAGKQEGARDERHLWPVFFSLIRECRPPVVWGEQVASSETVGTELEASFVAAIQRGDDSKANAIAIKLEKYYEKRNPGIDLAEIDRRWIDGVRADLETADYTLWFDVLGAHSVNSPHQRQRIFWGAVRNERGETRGSGRGLLDSHNNGREPRRTAAETARHGDSADSTGGGLRDAIDQGLQGHAGHGDHRYEPGRINSTSGRSIAASDPWSDYTIAEFRDGKRRRVSSKSRDEPLAYGLSFDFGRPRSVLEGMGLSPAEIKRRLRKPRNLLALASRNRTGRLKAYGNAIIAPLAAIFIKAFMESICEQ